jgi:hypothetical protein
MILIKVLFWTFLVMSIGMLFIILRYKNFMKGRGFKILDI